MKLSLNTSVIKNLKQLLTSLHEKGDGVTELEFRLGTYQTYNGKTKFVPGVSKNIFHKVGKYLAERTIAPKDSNIIFSDIQNITKDTKSTVTYYDNDIRKVQEGKDIKYEKKNKSTNIEIPLSAIGVRLSKSVETPLKEVPKDLGKIVYTRNRSRSKYHFEKFDIDLTNINNGEIYEIEIEFNTDKIETDVEIIEPLKSLLMIIFPSKLSIIMETDRIDIINSYNKVFEQDIKRKNTKLAPGQLFRFELKPRNIKRGDVKNMKNMAATNKLNGIGTHLFISEKGVYTCNNTNIEKLSSKTLPQFVNSIFPCELKDGVCHVFDCIKFQNKDISHIRNHSTRLNYFTNVLPELNKIGVSCVIKNFKCSGHLDKDTTDIVRYMYDKYSNRAMIDNDGIMYVPVDLPYLNDFTLKFKYASTMTIDFKLKNGVIKPHEKQFDLAVATKKDDSIFGKIFVKDDNPFFDDLEDNVILECSYDVHRKVWIPFKIRDDKTKPNFITVARDVFDDIEHPLELDDLVELFKEKGEKQGETEDDKEAIKKYQEERQKELVENCRKLGKNKQECEDKIQQDKEEEPYVPRTPDFPPPPDSPSPKRKKSNESCLKVMRKEHGMDKRKLINTYLKDKSLVDFGFGKGGVIHAYNDANVGPIYAVEPSEEYIREAKKRMREMRNKDFYNQVTIIQAKAQDSLKIYKGMNNEKADNGCAFFSLTFSFESEEELDKWINSMIGTIKLDGYFVGNTMDGEMTYNFLKGKDKVEEEGCYLIEKRYVDDDRESFGKKIYIKLLEEDTIVEGQEEYLVFYDILKDKLEKKGFLEVETSLFEPSDKVDPRAAQFSRLFRNFAFQRRQTDAEKEVVRRRKENKQTLKQERKNILSGADIDENIVFNNNYGEESTFVRTGTVPDGSCFFHAVLTSIDKFYTKLDEKGRREYVKLLRKSLADDLTQEKWETFGTGTLAYTLVIPKFAAYITRKDLFHEIREDLYIPTSNLETYITKLQDIYLTKLGLDKDDTKAKKKLEKLTKKFTKIRQTAFEEFRGKLEECAAWVGEDPSIGSLDVFEYISDFFKIDIYLLKDTTRRPYSQGIDCDVRYKHRQSVIVLWVGDVHYEAVAKYDKETKKVKRTFKPDHPIIEKIRSIIC